VRSRTRGGRAVLRNRRARGRRRLGVVVAVGNRFGLDSGRRLRRKAEFERLLREGARRSLDGYTFYLERRDEGPGRGSAFWCRASTRRGRSNANRIKRCIREAFRLEQEALGAVDVLVRPPYGVKPSPRRCDGCASSSAS